ncbi:DUF4293 domain-containing protein [Viscerimonas tarda]
MMQRIQSVYLLLVVVLMGLTLSFPLATFIDKAGNLFELASWGILSECQISAYPIRGIIPIGLIVALIALVEIFCYKKRKLQIKLSHINTCLIILFYITVAVYACSGQQKLELTFPRIEFSLALPIIALIFNVLALINIKKDEKLIRSLDRIR